MKPVWFREQLVILDCLLEVQPLEEYEKVKRFIIYQRLWRATVSSTLTGGYIYTSFEAGIRTTQKCTLSRNCCPEVNTYSAICVFRDNDVLAARLVITCYYSCLPPYEVRKQL